MKRKNGKDDPWCKLPTENLEIDGVPVSVRGLTSGELSEIGKAHKHNAEALEKALVCACITRGDGNTISPEALDEFRPDVSRLLKEAVARVNGFIPGNSNATGADDSSTA